MHGQQNNKIIMVSLSEFFENRWRYDFSYGYKWNYDYACTVLPYDIIKVKNSLVKSAHSVTNTPLLIYIRWQISEPQTEWN